MIKVLSIFSSVLFFIPDTNVIHSGSKVANLGMDTYCSLKYAVVFFAQLKMKRRNKSTISVISCTFGKDKPDGSSFSKAVSACHCQHVHFLEYCYTYEFMSGYFLSEPWCWPQMARRRARKIPAYMILPESTNVAYWAKKNTPPIFKAAMASG